jgi:hypothetical protein
MNRRLPFAFGLLLLPWTGLQAAQLPYPVDVERQHGSTLVIEHTPVAPVVGVRGIHRTRVVVRKHRVHRIRRTVVVSRHRINPDDPALTPRNPALAGGCYDGRFVERVAAGALVTLHRDVCEGVAPISWIPDWMAVSHSTHGEAEAR